MKQIEYMEKELVLSLRKTKTERVLFLQSLILSGEKSFCSISFLQSGIYFLGVGVWE